MRLPTCMLRLSPNIKNVELLICLWIGCNLYREVNSNQTLQMTLLQAICDLPWMDKMKILLASKCSVLKLLLPGEWWHVGQHSIGSFSFKCINWWAFMLGGYRERGVVWAPARDIKWEMRCRLTSSSICKPRCKSREICHSQLVFACHVISL